MRRVVRQCRSSSPRSSPLVIPALVAARHPALVAGICSGTQRHAIPATSAGMTT
jgi:hypothetical protein